tara:strand:- start:374 stop:538 length:165 start_codon:yes stop_codon:yes gene_type:complete
MNWFSKYLDYLCDLYKTDLRKIPLLELKQIIGVHQYIILLDTIRSNKKPEVFDE